MKYWVVLPAAGRGERFGGPVPKQYEALPGGVVIEHAVAPFFRETTGALAGVVVALGADDTRFAGLPLAAHPAVTTTAGGASRADSVRAGLRAVRARGGNDNDWVLVHDAARPCLGAGELAALLAALATPAGEAQGALLALPVADTVKRAAPRGDAAALAMVAATVPRDGLWRALTPQAFRLGPLELALDEALRSAALPGGMAPTDEAAAIEALGGAPLLVPGSPYNVKVTVPADLAFAATVLRSRAESLAHD